MIAIEYEPTDDNDDDGDGDKLPSTSECFVGVVVLTNAVKVHPNH